MTTRRTPRSPLARGVRILVVLLLLVVGGAAVFIATFDADRYRPMLVSKLQEALGYPVSLERLSLGWRGGMAAQVRNFAILEKSSGSQEPIVQVESASAVVKLWPLLRQQVEIASVTLSRPRVHVARNRAGEVNLLGLAAVAAPAGAPAAAATSGGAPVAFNVGSFRLESGTIHWTDDATAPPSEAWVKQVDFTANNMAPGRPMNIDLRAALGANQQNIHLRGKLTLPQAAHAGSLESASLSIEDLILQNVLPSVQPSVPQLQGNVNITIEGRAPTLDPERLREAVSASGRLKLADARIANLNVLRMIFEKMSMIPGLSEALASRLPQAYQAKLAAPDTVLAPIDLPLRVEAGALQLSDVRVRSDTFELVGTGRVGLNGAMELRAVIHVEPQLSAAIIQSVKELEALADSNGQLEIPLTVQGQAPQIAVLPDLNYLASKLIQTKVQDLIGNALQRVLEKNSPQVPAR